MEILEKIALENKLNLIDFYSMLENRDELLPDYIHPNANGAKRMAIEAVSKIIVTSD